MNRARLQVFANFCTAAAEAMAHTLMRTAHSTFVKETEDFACSLVTPEGLTFAAPKTLGATWYPDLDYGPAIRTIERYDEGDVCLTNDPYSGFVSTHSPDAFVWKPVFHEGELLCFAAGFIHNTDVGGAVPASLSRALTEIYQEGIRIPPMKLVERGVVDEDLVRIIRTNVRAPEQNWGDLKAQIASVNVGERKIHEIVARFGAEGFREGMRALLEHAEAQTRAILRSIPNGEYRFAEYVDEDAPGGYPCRVALKLTVEDEEVVLDFTGSDPQLQSSLNVPTGGRERHALATVGLIYVLYTLDPHLWLNSGVLGAARCVLPEGSVLNPVAPAAVGMRSATCLAMQTVTFGAFALAVPDRLVGCPGSSQSVMNVKTTDRDGRTVMASLGPVGGGGGGMPFADGPEGSGANAAFLRNTPVEINEVEVPVRILRYGLAPDSAGPGRYRGGLAATMEFRVFAPGTTVTARNRDRSLFAPWGIRGGGPGANSRFVCNPDSPRALELGNTDVVHCEPGDVIRIVGPGAGGYGDPWQRDPRAVAADVASGFVSERAAREDYGVVLRDGELDEAATAELRRGRPTAEADFGLGGYRERFEAVWTPERYDALTRVLASIPVAWRFFVKRRLFAGLAERPEASVEELFRELQALHVELR